MAEGEKVPELPEIETIIQGAKKLLIGKKIKSVNIRVPKIVGGDIKYFNHFSIGKSLKSIRRRGKIIILDLSNGYSILIHLKLTGQLVYEKTRYKKQDTKNKNLISRPSSRQELKIKNSRSVGGHPSRVYDQPLPHNHTHVIFEFSDSSHLYFNDIRKFGYLKLSKTSDVEKRAEIESLGPDPLELNLEEFLQKLNRRPRSIIKQVLMDQKFVAGIGNIYANEICFYARVRPDRVVSTFSENEKKKIFKGIVFILKKAIKMGGSSENTYVNIEGRKGGFMNYAKVYQQKECKECGGKIKKMKIGGRGTFYCPSCQKINHLI